jgi:hypothetical protein
MHILIIDNETIRLRELKSLLNYNTYKIIKPKNININKTGIFDLIILSGGSKIPVIGNNETYKTQQNTNHRHLPWL